MVSCWGHSLAAWIPLFVFTHPGFPVCSPFPIPKPFWTQISNMHVNPDRPSDAAVLVFNWRTSQIRAGLSFSNSLTALGSILGIISRWKCCTFAQNNRVGQLIAPISFFFSPSQHCCSVAVLTRAGGGSGCGGTARPVVLLILRWWFSRADFWCSRRKVGQTCPVSKTEHVFFMADLFTSSRNFMRRWAAAFVFFSLESLVPNWDIFFECFCSNGFESTVLKFVGEY